MGWPVKDCAASAIHTFFFRRSIFSTQVHMSSALSSRRKPTRLASLYPPSLSEWRPGAKRPACPLRQKKSPIGQAYSQFLNSPTRNPVSQSPTLKCATPQHQPPLPRSCTMHNALQHLNPPVRLAATMVSQGTSWAHRYSRRAENMVFGRALQCDHSLHTHTHMLCCNNPSLPPPHDICNPTHLHTRAATGIGLII